MGKVWSEKETETLHSALGCVDCNDSDEEITAFMQEQLPDRNIRGIAAMCYKAKTDIGRSVWLAMQRVGNRQDTAKLADRDAWIRIGEFPGTSLERKRLWNAALRKSIRSRKFEDGTYVLRVDVDRYFRDNPRTPIVEQLPLNIEKTSKIYRNPSAYPRTKPVVVPMAEASPKPLNGSTDRVQAILTCVRVGEMSEKEALDRIARLVK
jgi:hypothetical protein